MRAVSASSPPPVCPCFVDRESEAAATGRASASGATQGAQKQKSGARAPLLKLASAGVRLGGGRLRGLLLHRSGILPARIDVAVDEFDHADWRAIAIAIAGLEHPGV